MTKESSTSEEVIAGDILYQISPYQISQTKSMIQDTIQITPKAAGIRMPLNPSIIRTPIGYHLMTSVNKSIN